MGGEIHNKKETADTRVILFSSSIFHCETAKKDFAFIDLKLDVEVDGKFHYTQEQNIEHDKKRNEYLINNGWKVFRISIDEVNHNALEIENEFLEYLKKYNENSDNRFYNI